MWYVVISRNSRKSVCLYPPHPYDPPINPKGVVGQVSICAKWPIYVQVTRVLVWARIPTMFFVWGDWRVRKSQMGPWDEQQDHHNHNHHNHHNNHNNHNNRDRDNRQKGCAPRLSTCQPIAWQPNVVAD